MLEKQKLPFVVDLLVASGLGLLVLRREAIEAHDDARLAAGDLLRLLRALEHIRAELPENPFDRRLAAEVVRISRPGDEQALLRAGHRHVVETAPFGFLLLDVDLVQLLVAESGTSLAAARIGDAESKPPVRQAEDLIE